MTAKRGRHGDGTIDSRGRGRWRIRYWVNDRRHTETVEGSKAKAQRRLREFLAAADRGAHVAPSRTLLADWIGQWLEMASRNVSTLTHRRYAELLTLHVVPTLGARALQSIRPSDVSRLYRQLEEQRGLSARTVHHIAVVLGACLTAAVDDDLISRNPVKRAKTPKVDQVEVGQALGADQLRTLLAAFGKSSIRSIVQLLVRTGARRNEALALRWEDVNFDAKTIRIARSLEETKSGRRAKEPKTQRGRRLIAVDDELLAMLKELKEEHRTLVGGELPAGALLFPSPTLPIDLTRFRDSRSLTHEFTRRARRIGFPKLRLHDLRHSHGTYLLDKGIPIHTIAARLGHDPAVLLRTYAHRTAQSDFAAARAIEGLEVQEK